MGSSFLVLGLALRHMYEWDFHLSKSLAIVLTLVPPLAVALAGFVSFTQVLQTAGAVLGGFQGVLIWEIALRSGVLGSRMNMRFLARLIQLLFAAGIVYQIADTLIVFI